jgi:hypothetical protein
MYASGYGDPNIDDYGSYIIRQGRSRSYSVSERLKIAVMARCGVDDITDDESDWRFWDASWELMDLAQEHWNLFLLKNLSSDFRRALIRNDAKSCKRSHSTR